MRSFISRIQTAPVVQILIILNIIVFLFWSFLGSSELMIQNFLVSWDALLEGRFWTLLTSVFSHNLFLHLLLNMFVLNSFGHIMETTLGSVKFVKFYLVAGIISSMGHALVSAFILQQSSLPALGASGSISGVIILFSMLFPKHRIYLFGFVPVPAIWGALVFVGLDLWGLFAQVEGGGLPIGHGAHLGGALTGFLYYRFFLKSKILSINKIYLS